MRFVSDFESHEKTFPSLPGKILDSSKKLPKKKGAKYNDLIKQFAPVILHKISYIPVYDMMMRIDYDGNENPRDNVSSLNLEKAQQPYLYASVNAETKDSYYITYVVFHVRDYDYPLRELLFSWASHDSDVEGAQLRIDKKTMKVAQVSTWYHNRFFLCNTDGVARGAEPINGRINFENESHPVILVEALGHGVRCAQIEDARNLQNSLKIFRASDQDVTTKLKLDSSPQFDLTYQILDMDIFFNWALKSIDVDGTLKEGLYQSYIDLGELNGKPLRIGRYIAMNDFNMSRWARAKPPWSWDDFWDGVPIFIWYFYPSYAFESHFGTQLSHDYIKNEAAEKVFGISGEVLYSGLNSLENVRRIDEKWTTIETEGDAPSFNEIAIVFLLEIKKLLNKLFLALA